MVSGPFWSTFGTKMEPVLAPVLVHFWDPFWEAKVAETQGIQRVFALFCTRKGDRFGELFGSMSGPFLVHFGPFWQIWEKSTGFSSSGKAFSRPAQA